MSCGLEGIVYSVVVTITDAPWSSQRKASTGIQSVRPRVRAVAQRQAQRKAFEAKLARNASGPAHLFFRHIQTLSQKTTLRPLLNRMRTMNAWGWWAAANRKTILEWLAEEARRRGHQVSDSQLTVFPRGVEKAFI